MKETQRYYDRFTRNKEAKAFYNSSEWRRIRLFVLERDGRLCQPCLRRERLTEANTVHHIKALEDFAELALEPDNLESICPTCHNKEHPEKGNSDQGEQVKRRAPILKAEASRPQF